MQSDEDKKTCYWKELILPGSPLSTIPEDVVQAGMKAGPVKIYRS
jgi:hypothetical protein